MRPVCKRWKLIAETDTQFHHQMISDKLKCQLLFQSANMLKRQNLYFEQKEKGKEEEEEEEEEEDVSYISEKQNKLQTFGCGTDH